MRLTGRELRIPTDKTRTFPIAEPDVGMLIVITERGVSNGVSKDPWNCAIANSARETAGAIAAMIGATVAYIVLRINGETIACRFSVPSKTRAAIEHFDRTGEMPAEGFRFLPIAPSNRSDSKRAQIKRTRHRWGTPQKGNPPTGLNALRPRAVRNAKNTVITVPRAAKAA